MIRRFCPLKQSEIAALEAKLGPTVDQWSSRWLRHAEVRLAAVLPVTPANSAAADSAGRWLCIPTGKELSASVSISLEAGRALTEMMVAPNPVSAAERAHPLVNALLSSAIAELVGLMVGNPVNSGMPQHKGSTEPPTAEAFLSGTGAVQVLFDVGEAQIVILLSREHVGLILGRVATPTPSALRRSIEPRSHAIKGSKLRLEIVLHETGLTVADLKRLRNHDVIMFDHRITRPLHVRGQDGSEIGACYLGRRADYKAVKFVRKEDSLA